MADDTKETELQSTPKPPPIPQGQSASERNDNIDHARDVLAAGITGAVGGLALGGPIGAIAGGVAGMATVEAAHEAGTYVGNKEAQAANKPKKP